MYALQILREPYTDSNGFPVQLVIM